MKPFLRVLWRDHWISLMCVIVGGSAVFAIILMGVSEKCG